MADRSSHLSVSILTPPDVATYPAGARIAPRLLDDCELVWILAGRARWRQLDAGVELELEPGMLLLTRPGMREEFQWDRAAPTTHGYVHFDVRPRDGMETWPLVRPAVGPSPIPGLLDYLLWLAEAPAPDWQGHAEETIAALLRLFLSAPLPELRPPAEHPALATALDHVRAAWTTRMRPVPLAELAAAAGVSKEHLARLFREHYGSGPVTALELVRLDRAETLLARSNLNVSEIARACGFDDPLYFSKRFRAAYGASPRAYRHAGERRSLLVGSGLAPLVRRVGPR